MRVGIAIDVSTDVSEAFIREHRVHVLPSTIHMGDFSLVYDRDPEKGLAFYREHLGARDLSGRTSPFSARQIEDLFLKKLVLEYDYVFLVTLSSARSGTFENAHQASFTILQSYPAQRAAHGLSGPFALRVVDSHSLFAGPGVLSWELARLLRLGTPPGDIRERIDRLVPQLHAYVVAPDLGFIRARAAARGERRVSLLAYLLGRALDLKIVLHVGPEQSRAVAQLRHFPRAVARLFQHAAGRIAAGLQVPMVGVSYGGDPEELTRMPGYAELARTADAHGVELMRSMMSPAAAVNVGGGCVSLAYCGDAGEFSARS